MLALRGRLRRIITGATWSRRMDMRGMSRGKAPILIGVRTRRQLKAVGVRAEVRCPNRKILLRPIRELVTCAHDLSSAHSACSAVP